MAIKIVVSPKVKFTVAGTINDDNGTPQPFKFWLLCDRLDVDSVETRFREDSVRVADLFAEITHAWGDVQAADGTPLPYSEANLRALLKLAGLPMLVLHTYLREVGAKAKN